MVNICRPYGHRMGTVSMANHILQSMYPARRSSSLQYYYATFPAHLCLRRPLLDLLKYNLGAVVGSDELLRKLRLFLLSLRDAFHEVGVIQEVLKWCKRPDEFSVNAIYQSLR